MSLALLKALSLEGIILLRFLEWSFSYMSLALLKTLSHKGIIEENYADVLSDIDYVIDTLGAKEIKAELGILKPQGKLVSLKAVPNYRFAVENNFPMWKKLLFGLVGARVDSLARKHKNEYRFLFVQANGSQLQRITNLVEKENITPSIDSIYNFNDINKALIKVSTGHSQGKVIVTF